MTDAPAIMTGAPAQPALSLNIPERRPLTPPNPRTVGHSPSRDHRAEVDARAIAEMSPTERHQRALDVGDDAARRFDPAKYVQTRDPQTGDIVTIDRATGKAVDGPEVDPAAPPIDPATTAEKFKIGEFEVSEQEVRDLMNDKAARDLARAQVPADPKGYELKLPEGIKLPGDATVVFDNPENSAAIEAAQAWAHKRGLSQSEFSELLAIQAHREAADQLKIAQYARAEVEKLGATGPQRIDALTIWIRGLMGDQDARPIIATLATAAHVKFYEKLFGKITSQGVSSFTQSHRVEADTGVDDATYNSWSYAQKREYAERVTAQRNQRR